MQKDLRESELYREAEALYTGVRRPGTGQISDAAEVNASPDGRYAVFSGTIVDKLEGTPPTRICQVELASGDIRVLTFGPNTDRLPKFSPDGRHIAFLSDRAKDGDFQLYLLDAATGAARAAPKVEGWVEYLHWSPDGKRILLGVAGHGADIAGGQGAVTSKQVAEKLPSWMPAVETGDENYRWRRAWVYELATHTVRQASPSSLNIWEAVWSGTDSIAAVVSPGPGEGLWYSARLNLIDVANGESREIYAAKDQLGWPAASPSAKHLAVVDAVCSDRWIVAGDLIVIETASGKAQRIDTRGVDITYTEWRSERALLLAGHRGFDTVVGLYDISRGRFAETWVSREVTTGGRYATVSGLNEAGDCVLAGESFTKAPEIVVIRGGEYRAVKSFDLGYAEHASAIGAVERVSWKAPDGLEIQGWLLRPKAKAPHPLVMNVHGGPVWQIRPLWLGRLSAAMLLLLKHGYAVFYPNPRGSTGRGQDFVRHVVGDMGGADALDCLSGVDQLVKQGIADPKRLGVTGGSYGGFMSAWLIGQDNRFAAAVPVAPVTNQVTEHLVSNIPHFVAMFLKDTYTNPTGKYFERSPLMYAHKVKTPTLNICGALDRCTPPEEAVQFHAALLENGVKSVLVTYPEEGHGVRKFPAAIDFAARMVDWFDDHMGASARS
jgi:dipeptidyl aminopeptidase/acylaminoacyl peptidase